jgi:dihydroorotate dehydrogenase (fumarate)
MADLATRYLGLDLRTPIVASASPLNAEPDTAHLVEEAGAAALVLPSLFEEEILHEEIQLNQALEAGSHQFAEALDYFPTVESVAGPADRYLARLEAIKTRSTVPIIASLNATSTGGWTRYAALIEAAGADALELNLYHVAADPDRTGTDTEAADLDIVGAVRAALGIPLAVKLSPYYSSMANFARKVVTAGADGLVLFNRFYQPDLDLDTLDVVNHIELSRPWELRLPLRWIAILRPQLGPHLALAATSGIHSGTDVVKALMVGADVAMLTSAVLQHGPAHLSTIENGLQTWMAEHDYDSVTQLRGSATQATTTDPSAFERANYLKTLHSWSSPPNLTPTSPSRPSIPSKPQNGRSSAVDAAGENNL